MPNAIGAMIFNEIQMNHTKIGRGLILFTGLYVSVVAFVTLINPIARYLFLCVFGFCPVYIFRLKVATSNRCLATSSLFALLLQSFSHKIQNPLATP